MLIVAVLFLPLLFWIYAIIKPRKHKLSTISRNNISTYERLYGTINIPQTINPDIIGIRPDDILREYITQKIRREKWPAGLGEKYVELAENSMRNICDMVKKDKVPINAIKRALLAENYAIFYIYITILHFNYISEEWHLDEKQRNEFMNILANAVCDQLIKLYPDIIKREEFFPTLNILQDKYMRYKKLSPDEGESPLNTLFWEFGKWIALILSPSYDKDYVKVVNNNYEMPDDVYLDIKFIVFGVIDARSMVKALAVVNPEDNQCAIDTIISGFLKSE